MREELYREAFAALGRVLTQGDAVPGLDIDAAERRLGGKVPSAIREFYTLAGNARGVIDHYDHFLLPADWSVEDGKLVFLSENQAVVLYAVELASAEADPPVLMTKNVEPYEWHEVCRSSSEFLCVMVHWEGAFGGAMPVTASGLVDESIREALDARFRFAGEVNAMWAYGRSGLAVCLVQWSDGWRVFVGATHADQLVDVDALGVDLEMGE